ncbi:MAG: alkaline phosphatase family protein [Bacteroides sp.]|nr:alkaline phosphatase family protein [Bacteroides sp.]
MSTRKNHPLSSRLATVLVVSLVTMGIGAFNPALAALPAVSVPVVTGSREGSYTLTRPALVVGIFVEGLDADYIHLLRNNFGKDGFNRFIKDGITIEDIDYGTAIDATAATALLMTGAAPSVNGIPSSRVWDTETKSDYPILLDPANIGNFTDETFSPASLKVSTVSDEVRIADGGIGLVHAVAPDAQIAIILAGHAGNSGFWLNEFNGKWSTSTYYRDVPAAIAKRNYGVTLSSRLDTLTWTPSRPLEEYPDLPEYKKLFPFRHTYPARDVNRYKAFKESAPGNHEVAQIGIDYITSLKLGSRGVTDMLNLGFNVSPYLHGRDADNRVETMDAYLRLDSDIASIVKAIEKGPGLDNSVIFIAGTPGPADSKRDDAQWKVPAGQFSPRRAMSLLNVYLIALHGNGEYVSGYYDGHFFLNNKAIKDNGLDERLIRRESAEFLARMSGVTSAYTIDDIMERRAGENPQALQRNTSVTHAGDVMVNINPGWVISDVMSDTDTDSQIPVIRNVATTTPVYILAPDIEPKTIEGAVDARVIAPTVSRILRIRSPNAASLPPLRFHKR